jgi:hypothetical protein
VSRALSAGTQLGCPAWRVMLVTARAYGYGGDGFTAADVGDSG